MVDYPYAGILVADAVTFRRATNAAITVYDVNDTNSTTPLVLKDLSGLPLPNPLTSTSDGFVQAFVTTSEGVKLVGGGLTVVEYSHQGIKDAAVAAADAAQEAADSAATAAGNTVASASVNGAGELVIQKASGSSLNAGSVKGPKGDKGDTGTPGSNVLPTDTAIKNAITTPGSETAAALSATYAPKSLEATVAGKADASALTAKLDKTEAATTYATPATVASATAAVQKPKRRPDNITWITQFGTGHGWTSADAEINVNSTEVTLGGSQGVKYGPADPGTFKTLSSPNPISPAINLTDKVLVIAVKALDNNGAGLEVWLANAAFSVYRIYYPDPLNYQAEDGWTFLTIHPNANTGGTGTLDISMVERIRIRFSDPTGTHTEHFGAIGYAPVSTVYPNGVVTIDFDDNATGQFELARPLLIARNMPATIYAIGETADAKADGAMSVKDMHMLEDLYGWEIGAHARMSADHVSMQNLTDAQIADSVLRMRQWLTANKFKANCFAYPNGGTDTRVRNEVRKYFSLGRKVSYTPLMMNVPMTSGHYTFGAAFSTTAASITPLIDAAVARKGWLALGFHSIVAGASANGNMGATDLATVLDYIQSKGMAVVTPSTLFGLSR